ncbi:MAG TPA: hypothetical protein VLJ59_10320 [Mycobacteriales bacterium]|nr:hypothetical protein [Mycobacteriales bacterium]
MRGVLARLTVIAALLAPVGVTATATGGPAAASGCHYRVQWPVAGVYAGPGFEHSIIKDKYAGDIVGESCVVVFNEGEYWAEVDLGGGNGLMRAAALQPI